MSRIDELIAEHCPIGVGYASVSEVFSTVPTPRGIKRSAYSDGSKIAIVDQGQTLVAGYTDDDSLTLPESQYVVFGDHTRAVKWIDFPFAVGADGTKVLKTKPGILPKFGYYALSNLPIADRGYNRHWSVVRDLKIPVPPLEIQREIVRILDTFSKMEAELEAELEARKRQYEHYREQLLGTSETSNFMLLGDVVRIKNGKDHKHLGAGEVPVYGSGGIMRYVDATSAKGPSVLIPRKGSLGNLFYVEGPFWNVDTIFSTEIDDTIIEPKFLFHQLSIMKLGEMNQAGGVPSQTQSVLNRLRLSVPPLDEQRRIVRILDSFDALVNDLSIGLPAELAARRQQYEYYRDKLLTFKEAA